jgi:predicted Zn-dependent peptidase
MIGANDVRRGDDARPWRGRAVRPRVLALVLAVTAGGAPAGVGSGLIACGPATSAGGETTPTLPGDDPVAQGGKPAAKPTKKPAADASKKPPPEPDPWAGRTDLIAKPALEPPVALPLGKVERFTLPNGLPVLLLARRDVPVVSVALAVGAGGKRETRERRGLADFAAAMLMKGTKTKSAQQLAQAIESVGGALAVNADLENTFIRCDVLAARVGTCLDLLPDLVTAPAFDAKATDEVRRQLSGAVRRRREDPEALAEEHLENALWGDAHVRGWPVTLETIGAIEPADLVAWHAATFRPQNALLVVVGDFDTAALKAQVSKAFGAWKRADLTQAPSYPEPALKGLRVRLIDRPDLAEAQIVAGHLGVAHGDADYLPTVLMNDSLGGGVGSRLGRALGAGADESLRASSAFDRYLTRGAFMAGTAVSSAEVGAALQVLLGELKKMREQGPTASELAAAKASLAGAYPVGLQGAPALAQALLSAELHGLGDAWVRDFPLRVAAVGLGDVRAAAKSHLDADNLVVVVVGSAKVVAPQLAKLGFDVERVGWLDPVSKRDRDAAGQAKDAPPDPKKEADGRRLLDQAVAARGGERRLAAIKAVTQKGKLTLMGPNGQALRGSLTRWFEAPARWRTDFEIQGKGTVTFVVADGKAWVEFNGTVQDLPDDVIDLLGVVGFADPERVLLHYKQKGVVVQKGVDEDVDGKSYAAVKVTSADGVHTALVLLDPTSHLVYGVCFQIQGETLCEEYGDYRPVDGVQMPHKLRSVAIVLQGVPYEVQLDSVELNKPAPGDTFKR